MAGTMGCSESFLNAKPKSFVSGSGYFRPTNHLAEAINGVYAPPDGLYTGSMWAMAEMCSDNTSYQYNTGDRSGFALEQLDEFREIDDNSVVCSFFNTSYNGIAGANTLLDNLKGNTSVSDSLNAPIKGEAEFLRAFYYFILVRLFGDVPLVLHEVTSAATAFSDAARQPAIDVYAAIVTGLKDSVNLLPVNYTQGSDLGGGPGKAPRKRFPILS